MDKLKAKYLLLALTLLVFAPAVWGLSAPQVPGPAASAAERPDSTPDGGESARPLSRRERREQARAAREAAERQAYIDSLPAESRDSLFRAAVDSLVEARTQPPAQQDTTGGGGAFLDDVVTSKTTDSLVYDLRNKTVYLYNEGDVTFQDMNLKADFMRINMDTKEIYAYGKPDSVDGKAVATHPVFTEGSASYTMDTITYNIASKKAKIKGVATQEGDGWLIGGSVKKMPDNTINIQHGKYTTCDETDHPHFYLSMTKAKVIPGKKVVTGPAYLVLEDVPLYFLAIPEGFFPISSGPKSGLLMPTFGEESVKGFFLRDLGYYFALSEHMDLALRGGIYTLGSWEANARSSYIKRYKYQSTLFAQYSNVKTGEKGEPDYLKQSNFAIQWTHQQDPKANPGSTFSASVNFMTSGYSKYSATNYNDMLSTQTNSSISYSKNWAGTPFSLSASMNISQNSQNSTIGMTLPNVVFNVSRIYPFKRREGVGKPRWYEKISFSYTGRLDNKINAKESDIFSKETLKNMKTSVSHSIPVSASFNLFNYINLSPTFNYNEQWFFRRVEKEWDPVTNAQVSREPDFGFYRVYNYNVSLAANTTIYGMYQSKKKTRKIQAIRHTLSPQLSFSFAPDFSNLKYGFLKTVQTNANGGTTTYSPYDGYSPAGRSMSLNFTLSQTLEMKVLSKRDTSGVRKIKLIDELRIGAISYNFLADSMRVSNIPVSFRTTLFTNFGINVNMTLDPYEVSPQGVRYNKLMWRRGLPGRITNLSTSFGYTFKSRQDRSQPAINDLTSMPPEMYVNPFYDPYAQMDPVLRRQYMAQAYYDFSLPWNVSFNYTLSYTASPYNNGTTGYRKELRQAIMVNGSVTILPKVGINASCNYDFKTRKFGLSSISINRDLHCWQMSFSWIPFGYQKSWSFNIGVKAASLQDLKYDKSQSMYDNMF